MAATALQQASREKKWRAVLEAAVVIAAGFAIGLLPGAWLRAAEPILLLVVGSILREVLGGHANATVLDVVAYIGLFALLFGVGVGLADLGHRPLTPRGVLLASIGAIVLAVVAYELLIPGASSEQVILALVASSIPTSAGIAARLIRPHGTGAETGYPTIIAAAVADDFIGIALLVLAPLLAANVHFTLLSRPTEALAASLVIVGLMLLVRPSNVVWHWIKLGILTVFGFLSGVSGALLGVFDGHEAAELLGSSVRRWLELAERVLPTMFFMVAGYDIRLPLLDHAHVLIVAAVIIAALIVSRGALGIAAPGSPRTRFKVGAGMLPRGEVTIAMALVFLQLKVISNANYATLMAVVLVSTLLSALAFRLKRLRGGAS